MLKLERNLSWQSTLMNNHQSGGLDADGLRVPRDVNFIKTKKRKSGGAMDLTGHFSRL
jgi:hypothetical protein